MKALYIARWLIMLLLLLLLLLWCCRYVFSFYWALVTFATLG